LPPADFENSNWHMFQVLIPAPLASRRGELMRLLRESGIATGVHYPAIHQTSLYRKLGLLTRPLPHTESVAARILTLPLFPAMQDADVERVTQALARVLSQLGAEEGQP
jgi:dTDP-4-amino-4,6-dideoxygalactose transaminase